MKKGSITVFLALVLTLLFSFLLTTLEAARIRGATAYAAMVTDLAGESFLAAYYYPLFQNYRVFGVNAGDEKGFFSEEALLEDIRKDVVCGMEEQRGSLLTFRNTEVTLSEYQKLLSEGEKGFLTQIRRQAVLDGTSLILSELFSEELFAEAGTVGEVYRRQEEALEVTANVTREILRLMEQVDGIKMNSNGIDFDRNGRLQASDAFVKQIVPMEQRPIRESYGNEEVYLTVADQFYRVDNAAARVLDYVDQIEWLNYLITEADREDEEYQSSREALEQEKQFLLEEAEWEYNLIVQKISGVTRVLCQSMDTVETLIKKQQRAKSVVETYEYFLKGMETKLSKEAYEVFWKELERMKVYAGLEEHGFSTATIQQSISGNYSILMGFSLEGFSEHRLNRVETEMTAIIQGMKEYTTRGLWFTYGDIVVAKNTWENVMGALGELLTTGVLSLVGISKDEVSDAKLTGKELPSAGCEGISIFEELTTCMEEVSGLLQSGLGDVLRAAGNAVLDETALELYSMKYFGSYGEEASDTKLKYEREYLIFGAEKDKSNLLTMVLYLVAIRTLLCMVMILKQPDRMAELETLGAGVVGFTGMPVLAAVVKYGVMLLWAVEEALIEVSALLDGKRINLVGTGAVAFGEIFLINKAMIARKAEQLPEGIGAKYPDYLSLLSLTKKTRDKAYRAMDLIQENIRYRYNDGFRIRNVVTELSFVIKTELKVLFETGIFPKEAYTVTCYEKRDYER